MAYPTKTCRVERPGRPSDGVVQAKEHTVNEATDQATATVAAEVVESVGLREDLSLAVSLSESGIKEEDGVVRASACLIESGWSLNKRYYGSSLLR
ncbi:MAG: hypothetical protein WC565_08850, partial [Parcubacteria group bacterium]